MKRPAVVLLIPLLFACSFACSPTGEEDASASPTATPSASESPAATPDVRSAEQTPEPVPALSWRIADGPRGDTEAGTRCWGSQCIDMIGAITPREPATVAPSTEIQLQFEAGEPTTVEHGWIPAEGLESESSRLFDGGLVWPGSLPPDNYASGAVTTPAEPGEYLLAVFAQWDGRGDVSYGGYFNVE